MKPPRLHRLLVERMTVRPEADDLVRPLLILLEALMYIPHPDIITNNGAAIPPNAAATNAAGSPTDTPFGGMIAAVCTSTMHNTAIALILSIWESLI